MNFLGLISNLNFKLIIFSTMGGFSLFIYGIKNGYYKNNYYAKKFAIEILGASITGFCISKSVSSFDIPPAGILFIAFCTGLCWTKVIQIIRKKITTIIETILDSSKGA